MISIVVAIANNNVIGKNKSLAWHLPDDLKRFKDITLTGSRTMIMGRKTFESLPKPLPGRKHIILTQNEGYRVDCEDASVIHSIDEILPYINSKEEYFVIGGGQVFNLLLPYAQKMYVTEIYEDFQGDTFFPNYDKSQWRVLEEREGRVDEKTKYKHSFLILEKK